MVGNLSGVDCEFMKIYVELLADKKKDRRKRKGKKYDVSRSSLSVGG
jgi:hypothetical protein